MIDIPLGKALIPVESRQFNECKGCELPNCTGREIACNAGEREDKKYVIFKLVDYPVEEEDV